MRKHNIRCLQLFMGLLFLLVGFSLFPDKTVFAATAVTVAKVDYEEANVEINNNGNTKIYFATENDAARGNWEVLDVDTGTFTTIDFSWLSATTDNILIFKGDLDQTQTRVVIQEQTRKLDISIAFSNLEAMDKTDTIGPLLNIMTSAGTAEEPILFSDLQWKKGEDGNWKDSVELTAGLLEKYQIKGAYLYFRIKADNDDASDVSADTVNHPYPDGTKGRRASVAFKLKIAKKASPMVVGIDGEKFTAEIKYGKEYRVTTYDASGNATTSDWTKVFDRAVKNLPLATIVNNVANGTTTQFPQMLLEIRDYATAKTAPSKITEISLNKQRSIPGTLIKGKAPLNAPSTDNNIYVSYNGTNNMIITIPAASMDNPYEYCVVKPGDTLDLTRVLWTTVTKGTDNKVLSSKAIEGGTLYIRQREIKSKEATRTTPAVAYALASTCTSMNIDYPSIPMFTKATYTFTKGYSNDITFDVKLNVSGKIPFENKLKSIKLGTKDIGFSYTVSPDPIDPTANNIMTITLLKSSLETMTNCYARALTITFDNGTVDRTSIKLTVQNATPAYSLTATVAKGSATGTTAVTLINSAAPGDSFVYTIGTTEEKGKTTFDTVTTGTAFTSGADITVAAGKYLTIYEINATNNIVKYKSILITTDMIQP